MTDTATVEMAAPKLDYLTLAVPGCQILVGGKWVTVEALEPCDTGGHGPMCAKFCIDNDDWRAVHLRLDRPRWIRHQVTDIHPGFDSGGRQ